MGCFLLLPAKPCHAIPVPLGPSPSASIPGEPEAAVLTPESTVQDDDYHLPWLLCSLRLCAPGECRKPVKACQRLHRAALLPSDRGSQQAREHLSCACACTARRRGLIACSSYPRLVCLQIIIFRAVLPFPYRLSRCLFRLRGILKDHLAFLIQTNAPPTNHASR